MQDANESGTISHNVIYVSFIVHVAAVLGKLVQLTVDEINVAALN